MQSLRLRQCRAFSGTKSAPTPCRVRVRAQAQRCPRHEDESQPCPQTSPTPSASQQTASQVAAATAAALVLSASSPCLPPAHADIQTVTPTQMTQMARALPKQQADKGKVWTLFLGGAGLLFVGTVVAENNEKWFPAISRANKALQMNRDAQQKAEQAQKKR